MGFFSKLFGKSGQDGPTERQLDHPNKLLVGDIICLDDSFALPSHLKGQSLEVIEVNCYEFEHDTSCEWVLRGKDDQLIFMSYEKDDEERLVFSIKITRELVEQLFDLDQFSQLFDEPGQATLELKQSLPEFNNWLGQLYRQNDFATVGFYHQKDPRSDQISQYQGEDQGESLEVYGAESDDERYAISAEVYQDGETDVILSLYRPISDIRQYWPKSQ